MRHNDAYPHIKKEKEEIWLIINKIMLKYLRRIIRKINKYKQEKKSKADSYIWLSKRT